MQSTSGGGITIGQLSEQTGVPVPTIRSWEQRFSFPQSQRAPSGHRRYAPRVVAEVHKVLDARARGLSLRAAISASTGAGTVPSIHAAVARLSPGAPSLQLTVPQMRVISRAIEDEALAAGGATRLVGAFQRPEAFAAVRPRWSELARGAEVALVFASFGAQRVEGGVTEVPLADASPLGREWAVACETRSGACCLAGWEAPASAPGRMFEARWVVDPSVVAATIDLSIGWAPGVAPTGPTAAPAIEDSLGWAAAVTGRALRYGLPGPR